MKAELAEILQATPVIAILRRPKVEVYACVEMLLAHGLRLIEMTMDSPGAAEVIRNIKRPAGTMFGAGTVTDPGRAAEALAAGADFLVTPNFHPEVIALSRAHGIPIFAGAMTPTEIYNAMAAGADYIKVFPAGTLGPRYFREVLGPLVSARLVATGGITAENAADFFAAGAHAVGVGGALIPQRSDDFAACGATADRLLAAAARRVRS
ncbi:MAG: bifunctional 4-hydroxy-2-oxoglutarate aldolase/2-dehydro-3-deoxy-phosphogluconate aldolase, partial [Verrucomicrobia bacterium]|nr:bifunctional 4-hydroxy-2-oxoglutarate aldolase/2-dehydro-3-deoxy-phosphogluconate aldolase [Verrucomicrobiota bacterium]